MSNGSGGGHTPGVKLEYDGKVKFTVFEDTKLIVVEVKTASGTVTTTLSLDTGKAV